MKSRAPLMTPRSTIAAIALVLSNSALFAQATGDRAGLLDKSNLVAWCIVPFDAKNRAPSERAEMVKRLGLQRVAYDWRQEHVPTFEDEIVQYKQRGIEYFAFWSWHDDMEPLIQKHGIRPQIWSICATPNSAAQDEMVAAAAEGMLPLAEKTRQLGLKLGIYNHGGWSGQPENMVAVCRYLRLNHDADHVGVVYNFHHGHEHIDRFAESFEAMMPYLLCVNINGMTDAADLQAHPDRKIIPVGSGSHERAMIQTIMDTGYDGPIGILGHRQEMDVEVALQQNLDGLSKIVD